MIPPKILAILLICAVSIQAIALPLTIKPAFAISPLLLTAQTDNAFYYIGEIVKISGEIEDEYGSPIGGATIGIEVKDSGGSRIFLDGTWSQANGYYQDQFTLPAMAPLGEYRLYVTANKPGYSSASKQANFFVTTPQLGHTIIKVVGHTIELSESNVVTAKQNVTMFSKSITTATISNRLVLLSPSGAIKYDNFLGIGTTQDLRKITIANDTAEVVSFQFTLSTPTPGYLTHMFCIFDEYGSNRLDATPWSPAFLYTPPPKHTQNLGSLPPSSTISTSLTLTFKRFESAEFTVTLTQSITSLTLNLGSAKPSKFQVSINTSDHEIQTELDSVYTWKIYNLPAGEYDIKTTILSDTALLSSISLQSTDAITSPEVTITNVEKTSESATPSGAISYHVYVKWHISTNDVLNVSAYLEDAFSDSKECEALVLYQNQQGVYLTVNAPATPENYTVTFRATLKIAGISTECLLPLEVKTNEYGITILNEVQYYQTPAVWEWLLGARSPKYYSDPNKLSVLSVTGIHIIDVNVDQSNRPISATVEFKARNKAGSFLHFGDGPHYDLYVEDEHALPEFQMGLLLAGESEETFRAVLSVDSNRELDFRIRFKMSMIAEAILLGEAVFETLVSAYTSGWTGDLMIFFGDIVKLMSLNFLKTCTETEKGYMVREDIPTFFESLHLSSELVSDLISMADSIWGRNGRNPWFAVANAVWDAVVNGKIDALGCAEAFIRLLMWFAYRSATNWYKVIEISFEKARLRYIQPLTTSWENARADSFISKLGVILSILRLLKVVWDLLTMPPEEGKISSSTLGTSPPIEPFDPTISLSFRGSTSNTTMDYFGDVYSLTANITRLQSLSAAGTINYVVDPNMTATYLSLISQTTFQRNLFKSFGLNATSSNVSWLEGSNSFLLQASGAMYEGLQKSSLSLNSTWIQGAFEMSADAIPTGTKALLNVSLLYPFGKNLSHTIQVTLPLGSTNISVLSPGSYIIRDNIITWNEPIDQITVEFTPPILVSAKPNKDIVGQDYPLSIDLDFENNGNETATFNVTTYAGSEPINNTEIVLPGGSSTNITIVWDTTGWPRGNYTIQVVGDRVSGPVDIEHIACIGGKVRIGIPGDVTGDHYVGIDDIFEVASHFGEDPESLGWDGKYDITNDAYVGVDDIFIAASNFGQEENP